MSEFNPYAEWLGIQHTNPNYFQLLGVHEVECAPERIREAADSQLRKLKRLQLFDDRAIRQRTAIATRIRRAARCLSDPEQREIYIARTGLPTTQEPTLASSDIADLPPASAEQPAPDVQVSRGGDRTNLAKQMRRSRSQTRAILLTGTLGLISVGGLALLLFTSTTLPEQLRQYADRLTASTTHAVSGDNRETAVSPPATPTAESASTDTPNEPAGAQANGNSPENPPASMPNATENSSDGTEPPNSTWTETSTETERTETASAEMPSPSSPSSGTTPPSTTPSPAAQLSVESAKQYAKAMQDVWRALADRDFANAKRSLKDAERLATTDATQDQHARLTALAEYVRTYWQAADRYARRLRGGQELELGRTRAIVVERQGNVLVLRLNGANRQLQIDRLPAKLARYFSEAWLDSDAASTLVYRGAVLAVTQPDRHDEVRKLWNQANQDASVELDNLPLVLDDQYPPR